MLKEILQFIWHKVPYNIRCKLQLGHLIRTNRKEYESKLEDIISRYGDSKDQEIINCISYIKEKKCIEVFNANWTDKYQKLSIKIRRDAEGWPFYIYHGKKLYLKKSWSNNVVRAYIKNILKEQDVESPHRYFDDDFDINTNEIVFDVGAAEGNFLLEIVEKIKRGILIEYDEEWIEALKRTFKPYANKVTIIKAFVGDGDQNQSITLDQIALNENVYPTLIKMDIEGSEVPVVRAGISQIESNTTNLRMLICTYHNDGDESELKHLLKAKYSFDTSKGYMYYKGSFRRGLIRAEKSLKDIEKIEDI